MIKQITDHWYAVVRAETDTVISVLANKESAEAAARAFPEHFKVERVKITITRIVLENDLEKSGGGEVPEVQ